MADTAQYVPADEAGEVRERAAPPADLGAVETMPEFRARVATPALTQDQRRSVVRQASQLVDGFYAHLLQKRAMYAVDPTQRFRLLAHRLGELHDGAFHDELARIFVELRDLHTLYVRPRPYRGRIAALRIQIEQYWDGETAHWIASKVAPAVAEDHPDLEGAEILHWNGSPMALAVARNAEREPGSNPAARLARGLERMAFRPLKVSPPPDEDWVDLRYRVAGSVDDSGDESVREARIPWNVFDDPTEAVADGGDQPGLTGVDAPDRVLLGLDLRTEAVQEAKRLLFAATAEARDDRDRRAAEAGLTLGPELAERQELSARAVTTSHGTFGHLRIYTFHAQHADGSSAVDAFLAEVRRLLPLLPPDGLIVDVRNNGGGYVYAGEALLQYLTPGRIQPEPTQFLSTAMTSELCRNARWVDDEGGEHFFLRDWAPSIEASTETGAQYSSALPLYPADTVNDVGQLYHGPVVLVTDAFCYSTTDFFAAGFQDHEIGTVLGVDGNTGAGGANVWEHTGFLQFWPSGPFTPLPAGAELRVALRRSLRVGPRWGGQPLEDLGVIPDQRHRMTERDLMDGNADLIERAGEILARGTPRTLEVELSGDAGLSLAVTTRRLTSVDVYVNDRPAATTPVVDGTTTLAVPLPPDAGTGTGTGLTVRLEGFDGNTLVAARTLQLTTA